MSLPTALGIKADLERYVVGQNYGLRTIAAAVAAHYRSAAYVGATRIRKSNLLLLGNTGVGKTYTMQVVARSLGVPFHAHTATAITPAGWAGDDPERMVVQLVQDAKSRFGKEEGRERAKVGIIYLDEIDKLAVRSPDQRAPVTGGFSVLQVQQALLKIIEGTTVLVDGNPFPTDRILFVGSGAFVGLERIVLARVTPGAPRRAIVSPTVLRQVAPIDLIEFGFIPEFAGRFPVTAVLDPLGEDQLVQILRDADDSLLEQWRARLSVDGSDIEIADPVLRALARQALAQGTGARGLETALWKLLEPVVLDLPPNTLVRIGVQGIERTTRPPTPSKDGAEASSPGSGEPTREAAPAPTIPS